MATSGSSSRRGFHATAFLFSGRPDPEWPLDGERATALAARLDAAPKTEAPVPLPPRLGYRGVRLASQSGDVSWDAYAGVIVERRAGMPPFRRLDAGRGIERALLATAPAGALPSQWIEGFLGS